MIPCISDRKKSLNKNFRNSTREAGGWPAVWCVTTRLAQRYIPYSSLSGHDVTAPSIGGLGPDNTPSIIHLQPGIQGFENAIAALFQVGEGVGIHAIAPLVQAMTNRLPELL